MNIVNFFKENDLSKNIVLRTCQPKGQKEARCYQGSKTPIKYIRLDKSLSTKQDVLVCSRGLAEELDAGTLTIKDAEVSLGDNNLYGLIRPDTNKGEEISLW